MKLLASRQALLLEGDHESGVLVRTLPPKEVCKHLSIPTRLFNLYRVVLAKWEGVNTRGMLSTRCETVVWCHQWLKTRSRTAAEHQEIHRKLQYTSILQTVLESS